MRPWLSFVLDRWLVAAALLVCCASSVLRAEDAAVLFGGPPAEPAVENPLKQELAAALRDPMKDGMDVSVALSAWFSAAKDPAAASADYRRGLAALTDLKPLPQATWRPNPTGVRFAFKEKLRLKKYPDIRCDIVAFSVDGLQQYGVLFRPPPGKRHPLIAYVHGAAFGVPLYSMEWLAELASVGYVVAAPAFRGEPLFYTPEYLKLESNYVCEGQIENLKGEPRDVLGMADAAKQLEDVKPGKFAILGHSFGAGAGLLAAARSDQVAVVISYDAWFVNPFRFYWERLRGGSRFYWDSWEAFCEQPVPDQLAGLMTRSIVHHADRVQAPVLLFIGEYDGQGYHDSHEDLVAQLKKHGKTVEYVTVKEGGHNFVLYYDTEPARYAYKIQMQWLRRYLPPVPVGTEE